MKKKIISISLLLILALSMTLFAGCGKKDTNTTADNEGVQKETENTGDTDTTDKADNTETKDVIVMGTNAEFPPFESVEGGEYVGFDIDISKKIAEKLGMELKVENMQFSSLVAALQTKKVDFVAAGMTYTEEKAKEVNFSDNYFTTTQVIIVKKDNDTIKSKEDLVGKKIGVQAGTTGEEESRKIEDATVESYDAGYAAVMNLTNGNIDAVVIDQKPAERFVANNDKIMILEEELTTESYAIAVNKDNEELLNTINEVFKELHENGEYDVLYNKYFGEEEVDSTEAE
ncbi:basic amino acid ABC transporter substrate-binding protein [Vallitalea longa]|uniref:Basic amino acid ABC transporter substrate-binding protein n=1 Tax=Vallitalea longa TaxID=2936439 RepID=A0A9W5YAW0_9FIRM|nr:basic amino acid ABC transporter substrate-binding protein [Vallitalea longa]GKX29126.1 basic amino acid ABC transporter substrate-binding protein [Vallitalea longa]